MNSKKKKNGLGWVLGGLGEGKKRGLGAKGGRKRGACACVVVKSCTLNQKKFHHCLFFFF